MPRTKPKKLSPRQKCMKENDRDSLKDLIKEQLGMPKRLSQKLLKKELCALLTMHESRMKPDTILSRMSKKAKEVLERKALTGRKVRKDKGKKRGPRKNKSPKSKSASRRR
jgi:hypothetical protein